MSILHVNKDNFNSVKTSEKPVLLDFYADWCGPCRMVGPVVDEIARERADIKVGKVNVDEQPELARQYRVMSIPTLIFFKNGELVRREVGGKSKEEILDMIGLHQAAAR